ncbi:DNA-3-methyladenine glycosylase I [Vibrio gallicus]|uniref:DNA-3-methyladenine glycosylase I n=1 Tax=Vibrio gallicus TaxID=190897 RepID=UPI0021C2B0EB|nr:DNA-3-methyladenine glycosylase I [Vibrio gallicus]
MSKPQQSTFIAPDDGTCGWAQNTQIERHYHDNEWGIPSFDDRHLFECLTLEGAQAGLSWLTVLRKREGYQKAFLNFDIDELAKLDHSNVEFIKENYDIVRHKGKIASVYSNARAAVILQREFGSLSHALWQFVDHKPVTNHWQSLNEIPAFTEQSKAMSKFLKKRGFKFVGETICYAFMQAVGMVDDHIVSCPAKQH